MRPPAERRDTGVSGAEQRRAARNVVVLGLAFMVHFTAFHGAANLQSAVHSAAGAGAFTLAAIYFSLILSNIFLPAIVIRWLGCKKAVAMSFLAYMPFIAAQFHPELGTLVPAGMVVGLGGGPLWCAKCTYLSVVSEPYSLSSGVPADVVVVRFFGVFFMFYQMAQIWGNLISSSILSSSLGETSQATAMRVPTLEEFRDNASALAVDYGAICGANFCSAAESHDITNTNLQPPAELKIQVIAGVYLVCMASAVALVAFGVDSLDRFSKERRMTEGKSGLELLAVTLRQVCRPYQLLLLPAIGYIGAEQAFMAADFTQAFVGCGYGISNIGYVMICFGALNAVAAPLAGGLQRRTGRFPLMLLALLLNLFLLGALLAWRPARDQWFVYFGLAAVWGATDALWLVQVNALSGILFPGEEEAAYSNFRLWEATGSVLSYATAPYLCVRTRLWALVGLLVAGFAGYSSIELLESRAKRARHHQRGFELVPQTNPH